MLRALGRAGAQVLFTKTDNPRASEPQELARQYEALGGNVAGATASAEDAVGLARQAVGRRGLIVVCGSLYLVGAVLEKRERFGLPP